MGKVAIHGFGRIGRTLTRIGLTNNLFVPTSVSDIRDIPTLAALFEVDTNYGRWHEEVKPTDKGFNIGGRDILYFDAMKELPDWKALGMTYHPLAIPATNDSPKTLTRAHHAVRCARTLALLCKVRPRVLLIALPWPTRLIP